MCTVPSTEKVLEKRTNLILPTELLQFLASIFNIYKGTLIQSRIYKAPKEKYIGLCAQVIM